MFAKQNTPFNQWNMATIMLDMFCPYACNYASDELVQKYCLTMIKFVIQITLK
jgi:hypothetical protein